MAEMAMAIEDADKQRRRRRLVVIVVGRKNTCYKGVLVCPTNYIFAL
jgi:hypothetical protein